MPFDELYHKEKKLVDQVIKAEKALKAKEDTLPNPLGATRMFDVNELPSELAVDPIYSNEH